MLTKLNIVSFIVVNRNQFNQFLCLCLKERGKGKGRERINLTMTIYFSPRTIPLVV